MASERENIIFSCKNFFYFDFCSFFDLTYLKKSLNCLCKHQIFTFIFYNFFVEHIPVLFSEISEMYQTVSPRKYVVDATQGLGGHTKMLLENLEKNGKVIGIDRDAANISLACEKLKNFSENHISEHSSFALLDEILDKNHFPHIDFILYDLGVSSAHYDDAERGFSTRFDGPLDMRFNRTTGRTARDIVMNESEEFLRKIFFDYADEKKAIFIARAIVETRKTLEIDTTFKLLEIIEKASFDKKSPIRVFQALRIAVNNEFNHIARSLEQAVKNLRIGGKIAVITFHSIEDRIVKKFFTPFLEGEIDDVTGQTITMPKLKKINKKPIIPTEEEISQNPRSRSAKLRVYECIS